MRIADVPFEWWDRMRDVLNNFRHVSKCRITIRHCHISFTCIGQISVSILRNTPINLESCCAEILPLSVPIKQTATNLLAVAKRADSKTVTSVDETCQPHWAQSCKWRCFSCQNLSWPHLGWMNPYFQRFRFNSSGQSGRVEYPVSVQKLPGFCCIWNLLASMLNHAVTMYYNANLYSSLAHAIQFGAANGICQSWTNVHSELISLWIFDWGGGVK